MISHQSAADCVVDAGPPLSQGWPSPAPPDHPPGPSEKTPLLQWPTEKAKQPVRLESQNRAITYPPCAEIRKTDPRNPSLAVEPTDGQVVRDDGAQTEPSPVELHLLGRFNHTNQKRGIVPTGQFEAISERPAGRLRRPQIWCRQAVGRANPQACLGFLWRPRCTCCHGGPVSRGVGAPIPRAAQVFCLRTVSPCCQVPSINTRWESSGIPFSCRYIIPTSKLTTARPISRSCWLIPA